MSLESQLKKVEALKAKIKEAQSKIESKLGKAIIKALDLDYKDLSNKEEKLLIPLLNIIQKQKM